MPATLRWLTETEVQDAKTNLRRRRGYPISRGSWVVGQYVRFHGDRYQVYDADADSEALPLGYTLALISLDATKLISGARVQDVHTDPDGDKRPEINRTPYGQRTETVRTEILDTVADLLADIKCATRDALKIRGEESEKAWGLIQYAQQCATESLDKLQRNRK